MAEVLRYAAFTEDGHGGNPAGVVLDARCLTDPEMLAVAAAIGYSETAFVVPGDRPDRLGMRYFSPRAEVAFCGHATVATAVALAERGAPAELVFETPAGSVPVRTSGRGDALTATLTSPPARTGPAEPEVVAAALSALGWGEVDVAADWPAHVAHAGNDHLVLVTATAERLARMTYDFPAMAALMGREGWTTVALVHPDEAPGTYRVRNLFPPGGVVEDPATGAAAAAFGGYLRALGRVTPPARLTLLQGHDMGRPSRLLVDLDPGTDTVRVGGTATPIASPYNEEA